MTWLDLRIGGTVVRRVLAFAAIGFATLLGGCVQDGRHGRIPVEAG
jgi:hypothetical protein